MTIQMTIFVLELKEDIVEKAFCPFPTIGFKPISQDL